MTTTPLCKVGGCQHSSSLYHSFNPTHKSQLKLGANYGGDVVINHNPKPKNLSWYLHVHYGA